MHKLHANLGRKLTRLSEMSNTELRCVINYHVEMTINVLTVLTHGQAGIPRLSTVMVAIANNLNVQSKFFDSKIHLPHPKHGECDPS